MFKNALSFLYGKTEEKMMENLHQQDKEYFIELTGKYLWDVIHNKGENSQHIYDKIAIYSISHFNLYENYLKTLKVIDNYRQWEAEKLGWK